MSFILYTWKKYLADWGDDLLKSLADFTNNWLIRLKNRANAEKEREHLTPLRSPSPPLSFSNKVTTTRLLIYCCAVFCFENNFSVMLGLTCR
jgi:hypothetical protein